MGYPVWCMNLPAYQSPDQATSKNGGERNAIRRCAHGAGDRALGMKTHAPPLELASLHTKPSWHNRAGRVDRSACLVITAGEHWRRIGEEDWTYTFAARQPLRSARGKCDRWVDLGFSARHLWLLHKAEQPYTLQGDFRTAKSNAMKARPGDTPAPRAQMARKDAVLGDGPINPNRGVGFKHYKRLGLDCLWEATVRLERIVQHARLRQHFFVCPVCSAATNNRLGRCTKLYLPLCTPREYDDALLAQLWLDTHMNPNRPLAKQAVALIERYGELFEPRRLRCRRCLGLRYGEVKPPSQASTGRLPERARRVAARSLPIQTEQSMFLQNLPRLLAEPGGPPPTAEDRGERQTQGRMITPHKPPHGIDTLPQADQNKLLMLIAGRLQSFKRLEKLKRGQG